MAWRTIARPKRTSGEVVSTPTAIIALVLSLVGKNPVVAVLSALAPGSILARGLRRSARCGRGVSAAFSQRIGIGRSSRSSQRAFVVTARRTLRAKEPYCRGDSLSPGSRPPEAGPPLSQRSCLSPRGRAGCLHPDRSDRCLPRCEYGSTRVASHHRSRLRAAEFACLCSPWHLESLAAVAGRVFNLEVVRIVFVLDQLLARPAIVSRDLLRSAPFLCHRSTGHRVRPSSASRPHRHGYESRKEQIAADGGSAVWAIMRHFKGTEGPKYAKPPPGIATTVSPFRRAYVHASYLESERTSNVLESLNSSLRSPFS